MMATPQTMVEVLKQVAELVGYMDGEVSKTHVETGSGNKAAAVSTKDPKACHEWQLEALEEGFAKSSGEGIGERDKATTNGKLWICLILSLQCRTINPKISWSKEQH